MTEPAPNDDPRAALRDAIAQWYADGFGGQAVMTSFYLVASGTGFADDGEELAHVAQDWDADVIAQLGLLRYATRRAEQRMNDETKPE